tara:strand:- start:15647 stop:16459 length:813 start_codon:yes stop_codon:yes gene_type:complete
MPKIIVNGIINDDINKVTNILTFLDSVDYIKYFIISKNNTFLDLIIYYMPFPTPINMTFMKLDKNNKNYLICMLKLNIYNIKIHVDFYYTILSSLFINNKILTICDFDGYVTNDVNVENTLNYIKNNCIFINDITDYPNDLFIIKNIKNNFIKICMLLNYTFFYNIDKLCNDEFYTYINDYILSDDDNLHNRYALYFLIYALCCNYDFVYNVLICNDNIRDICNDIKKYGKTHNSVKIIIINIIVKILENHRHKLKDLTIYILENIINNN